MFCVYMYIALWTRIVEAHMENENDGNNEKTGKNGYKYFDQDRKSRYASVSYPCSFLGLAKNEPCKLPRDPYPRIRSLFENRSPFHIRKFFASSLRHGDCRIYPDSRTKWLWCKSEFRRRLFGVVWFTMSELAYLSGFRTILIIEL